ncbi:hypothetical protein ACTFIY_011409 [Dictyostelium cf. discoideum]
MSSITYLLIIFTFSVDKAKKEEMEREKEFIKMSIELIELKDKEEVDSIITGSDLSVYEKDKLLKSKLNYSIILEAHKKSPNETTSFLCSLLQSQIMLIDDLGFSTNGCIRIEDRMKKYYWIKRDNKLLDKVKKGKYILFYGSRSSGKTTTVVDISEQLRDDFAPIQNIFKKKVILFIDEFDMIFDAKDEVRKSIFQQIREWCQKGDKTIIHCCVGIGPYSITGIWMINISINSDNTFNYANSIEKYPQVGIMDLRHNNEYTDFKFKYYTPQHFSKVNDNNIVSNDTLFKELPIVGQTPQSSTTTTITQQPSTTTTTTQQLKPSQSISKQPTPLTKSTQNTNTTATQQQSKTNLKQPILTKPSLNNPKIPTATRQSTAVLTPVSSPFQKPSSTMIKKTKSTTTTTTKSREPTPNLTKKQSPTNSKNYKSIIK